ncbi:MAG: hypothetical protein ACOYCD_04745 [Kiritimatiellia bacterium]|jgi:hypothetical protein
MSELPLRGAEVLELFTYLSRKPVIVPLTILAEKGTPFSSTIPHITADWS